MLMNNKPKIFCCGLALMLMSAAPAWAQVSGSASITAAQNGANWNYTINLKNTGTAGQGNIETFWFAWIPGDDFLPSVPNVTGKPTGWTDYVEQNPFYGGYSIEFYDQTVGTDPLTPGQTSNAFTFTSPDSPTVLQGNDHYFGFYPITESYIYSSQGASTAGLDPTGVFNVFPNISITTVPEPASIVLGGIGGVLGLMIWRRRRAAVA